MSPITYKKSGWPIFFLVKSHFFGDSAPTSSGNPRHTLGRAEHTAARALDVDSSSMSLYGNSLCCTYIKRLFLHDVKVFQSCNIVSTLNIDVCSNINNRVVLLIELLRFVNFVCTSTVFLFT